MCTGFFTKIKSLQSKSLISLKSNTSTKSHKRRTWIRFFLKVKVCQSCAIIDQKSIREKVFVVRKSPYFWGFLVFRINIDTILSSAPSTLIKLQSTLYNDTITKERTQNSLPKDRYR